MKEPLVDRSGAVDELGESVALLNISKRESKSTVVSCRNFRHRAVDFVSKSSPVMLLDCKEVSTCAYRLEDGSEALFWDDSSYKPRLKRDISEYIKNKSWLDNATKYKFIGWDLSQGFEKYKPLDVDILNSLRILLPAYEKHKSEISSSEKKTTFISLRHHLIDIIMCPFSDEPASLLMTVLPDGNIVVSVDKANARAEGIHQDAHARAKKACYTGFALEDLLLAGEKTGHELFFSSVHGHVSDDVDMFFEAEMDSFNEVTKTYTEIKSSVNFNLRSIYHRRKLLRMWVQTSLLPASDLLIGFRNSFSNELERLQPYTVDEIFRKFNSREYLSAREGFYAFNGTVAADWFHYIFPQIKTTLHSYTVSATPRTFRVRISQKLQLHVTPIAHTPAALLPLANHA